MKFVAYVLDEGQPSRLRKIDEINLETALPNVAYMWLDAYLLRQNNVPPTSADIVRRFGLNSPTFVTASRILREALKVFGASEAASLEVKRQQWAFHLARVYGSVDVSNDEMFVRHTYLCQFAKILAFTAQRGVSEAIRRIEGIIDGKAFEVLGVSNIGEQDFFAWVLTPEVRAMTFAAFTHIAASLVVYDLHSIHEDLLKQLYQNLVEPETRHELGEFYTPDWLAELTLSEIDFRPGQSLLDPACGSGTFLFTAIRLLAEQGLKGRQLVDVVLENIMGIDVHPLAVTIAKINYMLALLPHLKEITGRGRQARTIPITMANALQVPSKSHRIEVIEVPIDGEHSFQIPVEAIRHPQTLIDILKQMGSYASSMAKIPEQAAYGEFGDFALQQLASLSSVQDAQTERLTWATNARWLTQQIAEMQGWLEDDFLYATLLSKHLVPFGVGKLHLVALPIKVGKPKQLTNLPGKHGEERFIPMSLQEMRSAIVYIRSADEWFEPAEQLWQRYKKPSIKESLFQWFNYQNKLTAQPAAPGYFVLYGATGSNLAATVMNTHSLPIVNGSEPKAFVVDHKTYWYQCDTIEEAHYLVALLNAPSVDAAIKAHQTRGLFGARDIHRRPFEMCAIPPFDAHSADHQQLAALSIEAHRLVATLDLAQLRVVAALAFARLAAQSQIEQIDAITRKLSGVTLASVEPTPPPQEEEETLEENDEDV